MSFGKTAHVLSPKMASIGAFSSPEAMLLLVSTKNRDLWPRSTETIYYELALNMCVYGGQNVVTFDRFICL